MRYDPAQYVTVAERLTAFYGKYPQGSIQSELVFDNGERVVVKALVYREPGDPCPSTGHAEEIRGAGPVNQTSALENCETSSWGRALAAMGFEVKRGIASREEMDQAEAEGKRQDSRYGEVTEAFKQGPRDTAALAAHLGVPPEAKSIERVVRGLGAAKTTELLEWLRG